jgi:hypothetical protein
MSEELTIESLAQEIAAVDQPEQPQVEDSEPTEASEQQEGEPQGGEVEAELAAEDEQPATDSPEDRIIEWQTASGEAHKVTERELKDGYLRQQDYTIKTQQAAEYVRQSQAEVQQQAAVVQTLAKEVGTLHSLDAQISQFDGLDWNALRANDPSQADSLRIRLMELKEQRRDAVSNLQEADANLRRQAAQAFQQQTSLALQRLQKTIPGFTDQTLTDLSKKCQQAGYGKQFLSQLADGLLMEDLWKARQWDDLQAKKPMVQNKVKSLPPVTGRVTSRSPAPSSKTDAVVKALQSTRNFSVSDFAGLLKATRK